MKNILTTLCFCLFFYCGLAQSHTYNHCCRYGKGNVMGDCSCPGCQKDKNDEIKAAQEETKQQAAKAAAEQAKKLEADKKAKEEAEQKKLADQKQRDENKIVINIPTSDKKPVKDPEYAKNISDKTVMQDFTRDYNNIGFEDTLRRVIFYTRLNGVNQPGFEHFSSGTGNIGTFSYISYLYSFPRNIGYVEFVEGYGGVYPSGDYKNYQHWIDIVHPNGKREFPNEKITSIHHLVKEWFILTEKLSRESNEKNSYLYNINTKQKVKLPQVSMEYGQGSKTVPLFTEPLYKTTKDNQFNGLTLYNDSKAIKNAMLKNYPDKVSEKLLEENILCIVICSTSILFYIQKGETNRFQILYLTRDGKLIYK